MAGNNETPNSPVPCAFLVFDGTTGALLGTPAGQGSWGASVAVTVAAQSWALTMALNVTGPPLDPTNVYFAIVSVATVSGANVRHIVQLAPTPASNVLNFAVLDVAGALAALPANTPVMVWVFRRNGAMG